MKEIDDESETSWARKEKGATRAIQHHICCVGRMLVARLHAATWMVSGQTAVPGFLFPAVTLIQLVQAASSDACDAYYDAATLKQHKTTRITLPSERAAAREVNRCKLKFVSG